METPIVFIIFAMYQKYMMYELYPYTRYKEFFDILYTNKRISSILELELMVVYSIFILFFFNSLTHRSFCIALLIDYSHVK